MSPRLSRDQRIVLALYEAKEADGSTRTLDTLANDKQALARVHALPAMILRHGAMLTLEYLKAKVEDGKPNPATLLRKGLRAALSKPESPESWPATIDLAQMSPLHYIAAQEAAIIVATWLKRLVEARAPRKSPRPQVEEAS